MEASVAECPTAFGSGLAPPRAERGLPPGRIRPLPGSIQPFRRPNRAGSRPPAPGQAGEADPHY
eukprot:6246616-Pyramimonas_sp.AAC.1